MVSIAAGAPGRGAGGGWGGVGWVGVGVPVGWVCVMGVLLIFKEKKKAQAAKSNLSQSHHTVFRSLVMRIGQRPSLADDGDSTPGPQERIEQQLVELLASLPQLHSSLQ